MAFSGHRIFYKYKWPLKSAGGSWHQIWAMWVSRCLEGQSSSEQGGLLRCGLPVTSKSQAE